MTERMPGNDHGQQCRKTAFTPPLSPAASYRVWLPALEPTAPRLPGRPPSPRCHRAGRTTSQEASVAPNPRTQVSSGAHPIVKEPIPVSISHHAVVTPPLWRGDDAVERVLNNLMER